MSDTPEVDAMEAHKDDAVWRSVVPSKFARRLERERDAAREELASVRKELVFTNRGAEKNAKINQGLCTRLAEAESERDEAMRERGELKRASIEVLKVVPVAYCSEMYHRKRDMHSALEPCPVVERYNARIDKLRALLKEKA